MVNTVNKMFYLNHLQKNNDATKSSALTFAESKPCIFVHKSGSVFQHLDIKP